MVRFWQISMVIGGIVLICGLVVLVAGIDYLWGSGVEGNTDEENEYAGVSMMICAPVVMLIAVSFLFIGILGLIRRKRNKEYAEMLKVNRRMKVSDFARKIGSNEFKAEKILMRVLEDKQIKGYMDRRTGEFFTMEFLEQTPNVMFGWKCSSCGAKNESVILPGESGTCAYCNTVVGAKLKETD